MLNSNVAVADDGFVQINARWLAPAAGLAANDFAIDSEWPLASAPLPVGLPQIQAGPFLTTRTINKENNLTFVETVYVSAVAPLRIAIAVNTARASFSGYAEDKNGFSESLSFDYHTANKTYSYAVVGSIPLQQPGAAPGGIYNLRREGKQGLVRYRASKTVVGTRDTIGRVNRYTVTASAIYEQIDPDNAGQNIHDSTYMLFSDDDLIG